MTFLLKHSRIKSGRLREIIGAVTRDFQQCGILTSVDSDEPVQPPFKLRNSKSCLAGSLTVIECAVWSELLLVTHTTLLEISCRSSLDIRKNKLSDIQRSIKGIYIATLQLSSLYSDRVIEFLSQEK